MPASIGPENRICAGLAIVSSDDGDAEAGIVRALRSIQRHALTRAEIAAWPETPAIPPTRSVASG